MTEHDIHHGALGIAGMFFLIGLLAWACEPVRGQDSLLPVSTPTTIPSVEQMGGPFSPDEVALARLVTNEASLPSRSAAVPQDGIVIGSIVTRLARQRDLTVADYVAAVHSRHTRPERTNRPWVAELDGSMAQPASWPADAGPWSVAVYKWRYRLLEARAVLEGRVQPLCRGSDAPITWGGRVDRERIDRMTRSGNYRIVRCGVTANVYLARVR